jgi:ABC-2 type transport system permease protein
VNNLAQAVFVETLKARRSRLAIVSVLGFMLLPLVAGFFIVVLKDPEMAQRVGLISAKARLLVGEADWPTYLELLATMVAAGGLVVFGFVASWVFGREFADRTAKDLLALPTSRSAVVLAKFSVVAFWSAGLAVLICLVGFGIGAAVGLPATSPQVILDGLGRVAVTACLAILLLSPVAFTAGFGRGYLAPMGLTFLVLLLAQVVSAAGWGEFFPWSVTILYSQGEALGPVSYAIVILTSLVGIVGTLVWWERADQAR